MKKYLIVGGVGSIWMKEYIKNIHDWRNEHIYAITFVSLDEEIEKEYQKMGIELIYLDAGSSIFDKIKKALYLVWFGVLHRIKGDIGFCEIHMPSHSIQLFFITKMVSLLNSQNIIVFWGSDILRINKKIAKKLQPLIEMCKKVGLGTYEMQKTFRSYYGDIYNEKIFAAKFGSIGFDSIDKIKSQHSKGECKRMLGMNDEKKVIAIGYSGGREHQHIEVIRNMTELSDDIKNKIFIVIHMGSAYEEKYLEEIKQQLSQTNIENIIICKAFTIEEIGVLRMATDVFVHAQVSDALSSTVRECIYAGAILVNPKWINYREYDELGVRYLRYSDFSEIKNIITRIVQGEYNINLESNSKIVYDKYSWNAVKEDWNLE